MAKEQIIKSRFRGKSEHTLDAKGRLNFPSRYREILRQEGSDVLMVTIWEKCLRVYPLSEWESFENMLLAKGKSQPGISRLIRSVVSGATEVSLDKQGRILLPASLRSESNIEKEVVLNGMLKFAEIWSKDAWLIDNQQTKEDFPSFEEALSNMGIF